MVSHAEYINGLKYYNWFIYVSYTGLQSLCSITNFKMLLKFVVICLVRHARIKIQPNQDCLLLVINPPLANFHFRHLVAYCAQTLLPTNINYFHYILFKTKAYSHMLVSYTHEKIQERRYSVAPSLLGLRRGMKVAGVKGGGVQVKWSWCQISCKFHAN